MATNKCNTQHIELTNPWGWRQVEGEGVQHAGSPRCWGVTRLQITHSPHPPGTWGNRRYCREDALWAQQAFSRLFESFQIPERVPAWLVSTSDLLSQRVSSLGSLHVSPEFISVFLLLFVVLSVNHTPPHLFTLLMISFYPPGLSLWALLEENPELPVPQSHNLLWWLCGVNVLLGLYEVTYLMAASISSFPHHKTVQASVTTLTVWVTKFWCNTVVKVKFVYRMEVFNLRK